MDAIATALTPGLSAGATIGARKDTPHRQLSESSVYAESAPAPS
jgi:hypothetical protein